MLKLALLLLGLLSLPTSFGCQGAGNQDPCGWSFSGVSVTGATSTTVDIDLDTYFDGASDCDDYTFEFFVDSVSVAVLPRPRPSYTYGNLSSGTEYALDVHIKCGALPLFVHSVTAVTNCGPGLAPAGGPGTPGCDPCPLGTYKDSDADAACEPCPGGTSTTVPGATAVFQCQCDVGFEHAGGAPNNCAACPLGTFKDVVTSAQPCAVCPTHETTTALGAASAAACLCTLGYTPVDPPGNTTCVACAAGSFKDAVGDVTCTPCTAGSETTVVDGAVAADACVCAPGYAGAPGGGCAACGVGTYALVNATSCSACPGGRTTSGVAAGSPAGCDLCLPDYYGPACAPCNCSTICIDGIDGSGNCTCTNATGLTGPLCDNCEGPFSGPGCNVSCACVNGECSRGFAGNSLCIPGSCDLGWDGVLCDACAPAHSPLSSPPCYWCAAGHERTSPALLCTACSAGSAKAGDGTPLACASCPPGSFQAVGGRPTCDACPAGTYQDNYGATVCRECPAGTTSAAGAVSVDGCVACPRGSVDTGTRTCTACPGNSTTADERTTGTTTEACGCDPGYAYGDAGVCLPCPSGAFQTEFGRATCAPCPHGTVWLGDTTAPCSGCPFGAFCAGGAAPPIADHGYYPAPLSGAFVSCVPSQVCLRGGRCFRGHRGYKCASCEPGWVKLPETGMCDRCSKHIVTIFVFLFIAAVAACALIVYIARNNTAFFAAAGVGFSYLQILGVLSSFNIKWPSYMQQFFIGIAIVNCDAQLFKPECLVASSTSAYHILWAAKLCTPVAMLCIIWAGFGAARAAATYGLGRASWRERTFLQSGVNASVTLLVLLYLFVSATALEIFPCTKQEDGTWTMDREPQVECYKATWLKQLAVSLVVLIIYSIGLPVTIGWILFRRRANLWKTKNLVKYGLLYLRFVPKYFNYEVAILARKFGVVFSKLVFSHSLAGRVGFAAVVIAASFGLHVTMLPFASSRINLLEAFMLVCAEIVLVIAFVFAATSSVDDGVANGLAVTVIVLVCLTILLLAIAIAAELRKVYRLRNAGITGKYAVDQVEVWDDFFDVGLHINAHTQTYDAPTGSTVIHLEWSSAVPIHLDAQITLDRRIISTAQIDRPAWSYLNPCFTPASPAHIPIPATIASHGGTTHTVAFAVPAPGHYFAYFVAARSDATAKTPAPPPSSSLWASLHKWADGTDWTGDVTPSIASATSSGARPVLRARIAAAPSWTARDAITADFDAVFRPADDLATAELVDFAFGAEPSPLSTTGGGATNELFDDSDSAWDGVEPML